MLIAAMPSRGSPTPVMQNPTSAGSISIPARCPIDAGKIRLPAPKTRPKRRDATKRYSFFDSRCFILDAFLSTKES